MNRELIDHIGSLLFGHEGNHKVLQLKSKKQFQVRQDGSLAEEQSVLTDITVGKDAIYFTCQLPDGNTIRLVNSVSEVEYEVDCNYTVGCIVYKTVPVENDHPALYTLFCDDDRLIFFGEKELEANEMVQKTFFEISGVV
jgi:hypothetical protein